MGQTAGDSCYSPELCELILRARCMPAARFILEVEARGHDPVKVLDLLTPDVLGLGQ